MQSKDKKIRLGFLGQGNLNQFIIDEMAALRGVEIAGTFQSNGFEGIKNYSSFKPFADQCEAVVIMDLSFSDFDTLRQLCRMSKHIYLEDAALLDNHAIRRLSLLQYEAGIQFQLGFKHRFIDTWSSIDHLKLQPRIIESSRMIRHSPKSVKLSVVSDLIFQDIDMAIKLAESQVRHVHATAVGIYDRDPDVVHCRIEFYNGCIANLSASKVSDYEVHKTRIFQNQTFITLNHINQTVMIKSGESVQEAYRELRLDEKRSDEDQAWLLLTLKELKLFVDQISRDSLQNVPGLNDYINAKFVAEQIYDQLERNFIKSSA